MEKQSFRSANKLYSPEQENNAWLENRRETVVYPTRHLSAVSYWFQKDMHALPSSVAASPRRIARRINEMEPASVCNAARQDYMKLHKAKMKWYVLLAIGPIKSGAAILWSQAGRTLLIMSG